MPWIDTFSPTTVGADRFKVSLDPRTLSPLAFQAVIFLVDYSAADVEGGAVLPLELVIQAPSIDGFVRKEYTRGRPSQIVYFPLSAGTHLVRISETGHNRAFGALSFEVGGDPADQGSAVLRRVSA
jgi:hypothetical protein